MRLGWLRWMVLVLGPFLGSVGGGVLGGCASTGGLARGLDRCIWVTRWDYRTRDDIARIMADCAEAGFTSVIFQVRGNGTVYYPSKLEVWSEDFDYRNPGFDPLAVAVQEAHARGLELHAWMNMVPGWRGETGPGDRRQLYASRPGWFLQDRLGRREPRQPGRYLGLNPCLPEVRRHLSQVCREVAASYDVDGIHMDYIRFTYRDYGDERAYPQDRRSLDLFTRETGARLGARQAFEAWKTDCLTRLVAEVRDAVGSLAGRDVALTAAVFADPQVAIEKANQDWGEWARRGLVDALFPMNYAADDAVFAVRARLDLETGDGTPVVMGVGTHAHTSPTQTVRQMEAALAAGASGVALFSYGTLFGPLDATPRQRETAMRRVVTTWNLTRSR